MSRSVPPAHVVIFGRPGSGKSSLAERLAAGFGFRLVRTGELLREAVRRRDDLGLHVEQLLKQGHLVPDPLIAELLERTLQAIGTDELLFDGFPRTIGQVPVLERLERALGFGVDVYLEVAVGHEAAVARMAGRRVCPACGATYHVVSQPPRVDGLCDRDATPLEQRRDDSPEVIEVRQRVFDEHMGPVLEHYRTHAADRYRRIDGEQPFEAVYAEACRALGRGPGPRGAGG